MLQKVDRTPVSPTLLEAALLIHADMAPEDRSVFEVRTFRLIDLLNDRGLKGWRGSDLVLAINFRLEALARLVAVDAVCGWTLAGQKDGATLLQADLVKAAAKEPLIEIDEQAAFDPDSFMRRVLGLTEARGRA